ncbi:MAG: aldo/keto reductase [Gammaproteobacteria bacterium]|nr:aldo/keto reductase [Gammaproteobacteria bacterium]
MTFSRRGFIGAGGALGLGGLLAGRVAAAAAAGAPGVAAAETAVTAGPPASSLPLITKPIPASGERIPAIGLGTDSFREDLRDEIGAELKRMIELGGTVVDTSDDYGDSEAIIGQALEPLTARGKFFLATKCSNGPESFTQSLQRLKTARADLLQVHNLHGTAEMIPALQGWKKAGKIRYVGITTSRVSQHAQLAEEMRRYPLDFIQVDYSIDNRDAAATILPLALERKLAVLVNLPFGHSALFRKAGERPLPAWAADIDVSSWAQFFLKYVISHPAVTCAIPGSTRVSHLEDNQAAGRGRLPDEAMRRRMEEYWDRSS